MTAATPGTGRNSLVDAALGELICPLCICTFKQPRSLSCLHSYCEGCLYGLVKATGSKSQVLSCPECRTDTQLTVGGVEDLPINFKLKRFVEILTMEEQQKIIWKEPMCHSNSKLMCTVHQDKYLEYFCGPCKTVICGQCMIEKHRIHGDVKYACEVLEQHVMDLKSLIPDMEKVIINGVVMLNSLKADLKMLDTDLDNGLSGVHSYFASIREILDDKEREIVIGMKTQVQRKEKLSQKCIARLCEALEGVEKSKLVLEDTVDRKANDIILLLKEKELRVQMQAGMRLVQDEILSAKSTQFVFSNLPPFVPDPALGLLCLDLKYNTEYHIESGQYSSRLTRRSREELQNVHYRLGNSEASLSCSSHWSSEMLPEDDDTRTSSVRKNSSVLSRKISSCNSEILQPVFMIETKNLIGPYTTVSAYPYSVCCLTVGTLLVTDFQKNLFRVVTSTGKCLQTFGCEGNGDGQFYQPTGITQDQEENIIILDGKGTGRVQKFTVAGKFLSKFKTRGLMSGPYMEEPVGVVVLTNGDVLVTDSGKSCVHIFEASGKYQGKFWSHLELKQPAGIAASKTRVVIADKGSHCIFILTEHGYLLIRVGKLGSLPGELNIPFGVAIHKDGHIIVSECGNHRISVFTPGGKFAQCFGVKGSKSGKFQTPRQLCFNHQGLLVVCDEQNQRLQLFSLELN